MTQVEAASAGDLRRSGAGGISGPPDKADGNIPVSRERAWEVNATSLGRPWEPAGGNGTSQRPDSGAVTTEQDSLGTPAPRYVEEDFVKARHNGNVTLNTSLKTLVTPKPVCRQILVQVFFQNREQKGSPMCFPLGCWFFLAPPIHSRLRSVPCPDPRHQHSFVLPLFHSPPDYPAALLWGCCRSRNREP